MATPAASTADAAVATRVRATTRLGVGAGMRGALARAGTHPRSRATMAAAMRPKTRTPAAIPPFVCPPSGHCTIVSVVSRARPPSPQRVARRRRAVARSEGRHGSSARPIAIAGATLNNRRIAGSLGIVSQGVKRGEGIAGPLRKAGQFPPLAAHLLAVGEETGRLDSMFARMAEIYEAETRTAIRRFTALFEPLIILVMGIVVGALILSMLLAITSMNEVAI